MHCWIWQLLHVRGLEGMVHLRRTCVSHPTQVTPSGGATRGCFRPR
jgi:hypothetical protein